MALTLSHYRFGVDSGTESSHGWHANEDTNPSLGTIALDTTFLLRFCVQANTTGLSNVDNEFQYRLNGGTWTNITTTSNVARAVAATALTNGSNCTQRLSGTGTFESSAAGQTEDGTSGGTANDIVASGNSETECGLQLRSADLVGGDVVEFRLTRDGGTLLDTYAVVPAITVQGTRQIVATSAGTSTTGAVLTGDGALSGAGAGTSMAAAILLALGALVGSAAGTSTVSGILTEGAGTSPISGASAGSSTAGAALSGRGALVGAAAGTSTGSGMIMADGTLAGSAAGTAATSAVLMGRGMLAGTAAGSSTATVVVGDEPDPGGDVYSEQVHGVSEVGISVVGGTT